MIYDQRPEVPVDGDRVRRGLCSDCGRQLTDEAWLEGWMPADPAQWTPSNPADGRCCTGEPSNPADGRCCTGEPFCDGPSVD